MSPSLVQRDPKSRRRHAESDGSDTDADTNKHIFKNTLPEPVDTAKSNLATSVRPHARKRKPFEPQPNGLKSNEDDNPTILNNCARGLVTTQNRASQKVCSHTVLPIRTGKAINGNEKQKLGSKQCHNHNRTQSKVSQRVETSFLSLPGELRNQIYSLVIPEARVLILGNQPQKELALSKSSSPNKSQKFKARYRLYHQLDNQQMDQGFAFSSKLLLVCDEIKSEVEQFLYSRTTFCFMSSKVINRFLNVASRPGIQAITTLHLFHDGYGNPQFTDHIKHQERHNHVWDNTCRRIGSEMTSLRSLKAEVQIRQWPCDLRVTAPDARWRKALTIIAPNRIYQVKIHIFHYMFHHNPWFLQEIARKLENDMMTIEGQEERDRRETAEVLRQLEVKKAAKEARDKAKQAKLAPTQAKRALVIHLEETLKASSYTTMNKTKKTGLDDYMQLNTTGLCAAEQYHFDTIYNKKYGAK